ncbi:MAG: amidase [Steroidobacteraceae bacterium]
MRSTRIATADPTMMSACELLAAYASKELSPVEVTRAVLARIAEDNVKVNAFCLVDEAAALHAASESEARWHAGKPIGLCDGVPATVKELLLARHWPTLRCSRVIDREQAWTEDAPSVALLRAHGAVLLGKTTSPEFGWKGVTDSPLYGVTRNPWDLSRTPGGSSGGAAAAAALGMGALHLGTDGGGSIRIPAAFTGIFGLKPSYGRVPVYPPSAFGTTSHVGPMTRTVEDAALMLTILSGWDARDWLALPRDQRDYSVGLHAGVRGLRIAYSPTLGYATVEPEIASLVERAVRRFEELGAHVELVECVIEDPTEIFRKHWYTGAALAVAAIPVAKRSLMDQGLIEIVAAGECLAHMDYMHAVAARAQLGVRMSLFHERYDLLITPAMPIAAFSAALQVPEPTRQRNWIDWTPFTYPFNLTHQPAATMPCGLTRQGMPVAMQIVGAVHEDVLVLRAARAFESLQPILTPQLPLLPVG